MEKILFSLIFAMTWAAPVEAKLGETVPQLVKRFGKSYTIEQLQQVGQAYRFKSANIRVDVIVRENKSICETYFSDHSLVEAGQPPNDIVQGVLRTNVPGGKWIEIPAAPLGADYAIRSTDSKYLATLNYTGAFPKGTIWTITVQFEAYGDTLRLARSSPAPPKTEEETPTELGRGDFTGRTRIRNGDLQHEVRLADGFTFWMVVDKSEPPSSKPTGEKKMLNGKSMREWIFPDGHKSWMFDDPDDTPDEAPPAPDFGTRTGNTKVEGGLIMSEWIKSDGTKFWAFDNPEAKPFGLQIDPEMFGIIKDFPVLTEKTKTLGLALITGKTQCVDGELASEVAIVASGEKLWAFMDKVGPAPTIWPSNSTAGIEVLGSFTGFRIHYTAEGVQGEWSEYMRNDGSARIWILTHISKEPIGMPL